MKAICISEPGGPEVLKFKEIPIPQPTMDEVLIEVTAAGVNRPDIAQRKGHYPAPKGVPANIPGLEVSGIIKKIGGKVRQWQVGDEVCALLAGGAYAEYVLAPSQQCLPVPKGLSMIEAASLPETFFTIWNNVFDIGRFQPGELVLIHGGSSGIGVSGIQMVKAMGGTVLVTAGNEQKCRACLDLGADCAINYRLEDFQKIAWDFSGEKGLDLILDMVGGNYTPKNLNLLKTKGRLVQINAMEGKSVQVDLIQIMVKRLMVTGSTLRPQSPEYKGKIAEKLLKNIWPLFPEKIRPVVHSTFPMAEVGNAHRLMESSSHIGKIVLVND